MSYQPVGGGDYYSGSGYEVLVGSDVFVRGGYYSSSYWTRLGTYVPGGGTSGGAGYRFYDTMGQPMPGMAAVDADENFLGLPPGVTAITAYGAGVPKILQWADAGTPVPRDAHCWFQKTESGAYVAKFTGVPNGMIQIVPTGGGQYCSPPYYLDGTQSGDRTFDRTIGDGWPAANLFNDPPQTMYVNAQPYGLVSVLRSSAPGTYSEEFTYQSSNGRQAGFHRYLTMGGAGSVSATGDVWASPADNVQLSGGLDPYSLAVSGLTTTGGGAPGGITFSAPTGLPIQGPPWISWGTSTLPFLYTAGDGSDVYFDPAGSKYVQVGPRNSVGRCTVNACESPWYMTIWSGGYGSQAGTFDAGSPLLAITANGELLGTPPGVVAFFGADPGMVWLYPANQSTTSPSYSWKTPSGAWGMKFTGVPARPFVVDAGMGGISPVYRWSASSTGDLVVSTSGGGWSGSNIHPPTVTVNAVTYSKTGEASDASQPYGSGSATYFSGDGLKSLVLTWSWTVINSVPTWAGTWEHFISSVASDTGTWDGGDGFSVGSSVRISLSPAATAARFGPGQIAWDGVILTFNPFASFMSGGDDIFTDSTGNVRAQVNSSGGVQLTNTTTGITASGTYHAGTNRFDFGTSFTGVVQGMGIGESLIGDLILAGSLDVHGGTFNFATDAGSLNKPAFAWLHRSGPILAGAPSGNHLRWLTATSLYNWTWEAPTSPGYYTPLMALRSHPFPTLALSVPITNPAGPVVIGPYADTSVHTPSGTNRTQGVLVVAAGSKTGYVVTPRNAMRVLTDGTVLIQPGGDITMGEFTAGPQP